MKSIKRYFDKRKREKAFEEIISFVESCDGKPKEQLDKELFWFYAAYGEPKSKVIKEYEKQRLADGRIFPSEISDIMKKRVKKIFEKLGEDGR